MSAAEEDLLDPDVFVSKLRVIGSQRYHDKHPFHVLMNAGKLGRPAIQCWAVNRFYYQASIPIKDAVILSRCPERDVRRIWLHRIVDHDGVSGDEGGIGAWLRLGAACGLERDCLLSNEGVLPRVRAAVDSYVEFAQTQPWPVAIASSLTELFAPDLMSQRLSAFERHYRWIDPAGLEYFKSRLIQAKRDSAEALDITLTHCKTRELQELALCALRFKCDLLWTLLDSIHQACTRPEQEHKNSALDSSPARRFAPTELSLK